jgi:hypothetical protein
MSHSNLGYYGQNGQVFKVCFRGRRAHVHGAVMRWLKTVFGEILGLFVDDGSFALSIVV